MKYDIQFTNQFKKDLKLAKKQNTEIMILQATIRARVSVTSNRTGCLFIRFVEMFLF